jgi:hypothetical protein
MMVTQNIWQQYGGSLLNPHINGMDQVAFLAEQGRPEEARDLLISCARAAWQYRWRTERSYTLRRLGEELDVDRYPELRPIAENLCAEQDGSAAQFLDYLRRRREPDVSAYRQKPAPPAQNFCPAGQYSGTLWQAWVTTGNPEYKAHLDQRIALYLDPHRIITWHETASHWPGLVWGAIFHGGIDDETLCHLILFGLDHAEECNITAHLAEPAQPSIGGNHLFAWITAGLQFTLLFPEFRRSPSLQFSAIARLDDETSKQVMPDGSMIEGCPGYHNCCIYGASLFLRMAEQFHFVLPDRLRQAWERMLRFAIGLQQPDFRAPYFGDSQDNYTPWFMGQARRFFSLSEADWTATEGKEGVHPSSTSCAFPSIGYYVQRSDWTRDALYLCFDGGRFGQAHFHEDKLHFVLHAYGRPFLVDAGNHSYSDHWMAQWSVLSQAHNTILVDGVGQCRWRSDRREWYSPVPLKNRWVTEVSRDVVEADFAGPYERDIGPVKIRRRILFHKGQTPCWWITDWIEGTGPHEVTELFHFAHDIAIVDEIPGGVLSRISGGPDLAILVSDSSLPVRRFRGEHNPPRGWVAPQLGATEAAWEIQFGGHGSLPLRRDFLLLPWRKGFQTAPSAQWNIGQTESQIEFRVGPESFLVSLPEN